MSEHPTGADLVHQLWIAARANGVMIGDYVRPLTNQPPRYLRQLRAAERPGPQTIARIEALIAGAPIPEPRSRNVLPTGAGIRPPAQDVRAEIELRRAIAEAAAAWRRPGETLFAAVKRVELELRAA
jgi:hypothetical protein